MNAYRWSYHSYIDAMRKVLALKAEGIKASVYLSYSGDGWVVTA